MNTVLAALAVAVALFLLGRLAYLLHDIRHVLRLIHLQGEEAIRRLRGQV